MRDKIQKVINTLESKKSASYYKRRGRKPMHHSQVDRMMAMEHGWNDAIILLKAILKEEDANDGE